MSQLALSMDSLRKIPLFRNLNDTECRQIAEIASSVEFPPGDYLVRHGETCQNLWILLEGTCEVYKPLDSKPNEGLVLAVLEPHSIFGEMSFFHKAPHSASVRAKTAVKLLRIRRADYDDLVGDEALGAYKLAFNAVASMAERLRRMDDWIAELTKTQPKPIPGPEARASEWDNFRDKMFTSWNL